MSDLPALEALSRRLRLRLIRMSHEARSAHLGGALSCVDLLVALYFDGILRIDPARPRDPSRDRLIFSKGHAVSALYSVLALRGFFPEDRLADYNRPGAGLPEHPAPWQVPGVEWATGSLGHGLGVGLGMALAAAIQKQDHSVFVLMSDGECQEGSVWEAAMLAPRLPLAPLTVLIDFNGWQATGRSRDVMQMEPLADKWRAFGWDAADVDGHNLPALLAALRRPRDGRPRVLVARTVKGKGASFIEDDNNWHYRIPNEAEMDLVREELGLS